VIAIRIGIYREFCGLPCEWGLEKAFVDDDPNLIEGCIGSGSGVGLI